MRLFKKIKERCANSPVLKTGMIYLLTDSINNAIPFLLLPIIAKFLSTAEYGSVANFTILVGIFMVLVSVGLEGAISANYFKLSRDRLVNYISSAIFIVVGAFFVLTIVITASRNVIYDFIKIPYSYQLLALVLAFFQIIVQINLNLWRLESKALNFGIFQIFQTLVNFGLSLYFVIVLHLGWKGRADGYLLATIVFGILCLIILKKRNYLKLTFTKGDAKDALKFGVPLLPHSLSMWIRSGIDRVFITKYLGESANGIFSTGFQFGIVMSFITVAFNNTFIPYLFKKLSNNDLEALKKDKVRLVRMSYIIMGVFLVLSVLLSIVSVFLVKLLFPPSYARASSIIFWAILGQAFQGMYFVVGNYVLYVKKTKFFSIVTFSCSVVQVILSYILILKFGIMGAAYSSATISLLNFLAVWYYSNKAYTMPWFDFRKLLYAKEY